MNILIQPFLYGQRGILTLTGKQNFKFKIKRDAFFLPSMSCRFSECAKTGVTKLLSQCDDETDKFGGNVPGFKKQMSTGLHMVLKP